MDGRGYAVKVDELGKLIDDLGTAADRMAGANRKLGGGGAFGSLGTAELGTAGVEFEEAWGFGIGRLGEAASSVTERLRAAKQKYEQIEAQFGGELGKFGSAVLGGPPDGGHPGGARGHYPVVGQPGAGPAGSGHTGGEGPVGGGVTGGVPGIGGLAERGGSGVGEGPVGGGYTGGVPGIGGLAERGGSGAGQGEGPVGGGVPGIGRPAGPEGTEPGNDRPVGGGATGGITDLLNGLDR
ncbi:hypothetical protein [Amycolatopsis sp. DG1A-15b]|uniref:hypothetical protein n=1 Tax=Amycolatopsis sp. DG1A-15b TaxID=3052846 RepID=UPI00255B4BA3|nr:hypothetical protein [Amycolatopsis sp. DG1A-15b]WIX86448.1 hypothetical protein QRY02_35420 [Amycolatopsis sp. DG1A-15b]